MSPNPAILTWAPSSRPFTITDSFNRAASTTTLGTTDTGQTWAYSGGSVFGIFSNAAYKISPANRYDAATVTMPGTRMAVTIQNASVTGGQYPGLVARFVDSSNSYILFADASSPYWTLVRRISGANTMLATSTSLSNTAAATLTLTDAGAVTNVLCVIGGTTLYSGTDSTVGRPNGTGAGIFLYSNSTSPLIDSFTASSA